MRERASSLLESDSHEWRRLQSSEGKRRETANATALSGRRCTREAKGSEKLYRKANRKAKCELGSEIWRHRLNHGNGKTKASKVNAHKHRNRPIRSSDGEKKKTKGTWKRGGKSINRLRRTRTVSSIKTECETKMDTAKQRFSTLTKFTPKVLLNSVTQSGSMFLSFFSHSGRFTNSK